ncbi:hypothetical protein E2C01_101594 [Portunus trituberculatus]|uniref:Uncharacterized protein n=1 Tax=Portunus trituberculatus TaxID=210409 RepID=A0A5B7KMB3_PORTR|nr:hypothetical protein [Portunus trituberculatus]
MFVSITTVHFSSIRTPHYLYAKYSAFPFYDVVKTICTSWKHKTEVTRAFVSSTALISASSYHTDSRTQGLYWDFSLSKPSRGRRLILLIALRRNIHIEILTERNEARIQVCFYTSRIHVRFVASN